MTLKKMCTYGIFGIFILCFLTHFLYSWFPNFFFSLLFPVNESIWEHMKMIVSSIVIWEVFEYFVLKHFEVKFNNFVFSTFIMSVLSVIVFLLIYLPLYLFLGNNFILNIVCLFISIYFVSVVGFYIKRQNHIEYGFVCGIIGITLLYIMFFIFTYFPPKCLLFMDPLHNSYGLKTSK